MKPTSGDPVAQKQFTGHWKKESMCTVTSALSSSTLLRGNLNGRDFKKAKKEKNLVQKFRLDNYQLKGIKND